MAGGGFVDYFGAKPLWVKGGGGFPLRAWTRPHKGAAGASICQAAVTSTHQPDL